MGSVTIVGAGLAGSLMAIYLAKRRYHVELLELRPDLRKVDLESGRSINLAMSCRGLTGLAGAGLASAVRRLMVPMRGRAIHEENGEIKYQPFGRYHDEYINAIQRNDLNKLLLNELEKFSNAQLHFNIKLSYLDFHKKTIHFLNQHGKKSKIIYHHLIGADGVNSFVREKMQEEKLISFKRTFLSHGYKELSIQKAHATGLASEHLHLWPRDSFLLLGNPNRDNSITGSLFLPKKGKKSFAELTNEIAIHSFFSEVFKDVHQDMPNLIEEFLHHPTGNMSTIKCAPWHYKGECLLIGDAAHGVVPFFGQGMNSAFEDCRILNELLDYYEENWEQMAPAFYKARKVNTDAVAKMSMENYQEIQQKIRDPQFNLKKQLEHVLMHHYPEYYVSKHVLVMFTNTPYAEAWAQGQLQKKLLTQICKDIKSIEEINWVFIENLIKDYDKKLAKLANFKNFN